MDSSSSVFILNCDSDGDRSVGSCFHPLVQGSVLWSPRPFEFLILHWKLVFPSKLSLSLFLELWTLAPMCLVWVSLHPWGWYLDSFHLDILLVGWVLWSFLRFIYMYLVCFLYLELSSWCETAYPGLLSFSFVPISLREIRTSFLRFPTDFKLCCHFNFQKLSFFCPECSYFKSIPPHILFYGYSVFCYSSQD